MDSALLTMLVGWAFVLVYVPLVVFPQKKTHPSALFVLFFTELWERFSFYGMRAFLTLYMTKQLFVELQDGDNTARALGVYGATNALLYAMPVLGGMMADRLIGFRKSIILGGILMAIAQFLLAYNTLGNNQWIFFMGLATLTVGNGFFKPNISSFLGTFYDKTDSRKDQAFTIFYMGINIGAFLAPLTCGYLAENVHWGYGFLLAGVGMTIGTLMFYFNMKKYPDKGLAPDPAYVKKPLLGPLNVETLIVLGSVLTIPVLAFLINAEEITTWILGLAGVLSLGYILYIVSQESKEDGQRLLVFLALFFFHMIFWTMFEQAGGSLTVLTDKFVNRHGVSASQFQSVNALFIILLAPIFTWIWQTLSKRNTEPGTPMKFFYGLIQMALGYATIVLGIKMIGPAGIPLIFLMVMYFWHTTGELSISPVGLSVVTKLAPAKIVGLVMGTWFLSISFAHKIAAYLGKLTSNVPDDASQEVALASYTSVYLNWGVYLVLGLALLLLLLVPVLKKWSHGVK